MNGLIVIDGFQVRRDVAGRYCLNDLHRVSGGEKTTPTIELEFIGSNERVN